MRKNVFGRRLQRDAKERKALFRGLLTSLVLHEQIRTTEQKAKSIKGDADKMITKAKKGGNNARQFAESFIYPNGVEKLLKDIAPRFANRSGGYTRIIRLGRRFNDNASMVIIEWVDKPQTITRVKKVDEVRKVEKENKKKVTSEKMKKTETLKKKKTKKLSVSK